MTSSTLRYLAAAALVGLLGCGSQTAAPPAPPAPERPRVNRIKGPHRQHPAYAAMMRSSTVLDVVADLNKCKDEKLPLPDDSIDEFLLSHVIAHISTPLDLMQELHRIAKPGAVAKIRVPYGSSDDAFEDPTHVRQYTASGHRALRAASNPAFAVKQLSLFCN